MADATAEDAGLVDGEQYDRPAPPPGVRPIGTLTRPGRATVEGRVYAVEIRPVEHNTVLAAEIADSTGQLTALFYGRSHIPGVECGARVRFRGQVGMREGGPVMINPAYELVAPGAPGQAPAKHGRRRGSGAGRLAEATRPPAAQGQHDRALPWRDGHRAAPPDPDHGAGADHAGRGRLR